MVYRITAAEIFDFKRIHEIRIIPEADASLLLIAGANTQGKSSILDALTSLFGGKSSLPPEPVRRGAEQARVLGEISDPIRGTLRIEREIDADGATTLKITGPDGKVSAPQKLLDTIFGTRALDPLAFLNLHPKEQRATLFAVIDTDSQLAKLDQNYADHYEKRHSLGLSVKHASGELERLPPEAEIPPTVDLAAWATDLREIERRRSECEAMIRAASDTRNRKRHNGELWEIARKDATAIQERRKKLIAELAKVDAEIVANESRQDGYRAAAAEIDREIEEADIAAASAEKSLPDHRREATEAQAKIAGANAANKRATEAEVHNRRRREAAGTVERFQKQYDDETALLEKIDRRKSAILAAAKLPVENLSYNADGILLNGIPLSQASGAEKLRVAVGIAAAASPNLADIWIRDAAILDDDQMAILADFAAANGRRIWAEIIRPEEGAIVISDGRVIA